MMDKINNYVPAVSIGMPVYNGEKYIREALDSLLAQTFSDFELIISDNCSTDKTQEICIEYSAKDSRIRYINQLTNIGITANFEFVLKEAQAKYFMWAASDDFWSNNWIELLYIKASQSIDIAAFGKVVPVDKFSKPINHIAVEQNYSFLGGKVFRRIIFYILPESMGKANVIHGLYNTVTLRKINISNYNYDYILIFDLLIFLQIISVSDIYFYKRIYAESAGNEIKSTNIFHKLIKILVPLRFDLLRQYLIHSSFQEKLLVIVFIPVKFLFIYLAFIKTYINKLFS